MVSWIGSKGVEAGRGLSREKDVSAQSTQVNLNQWLNEGTASPGYKKENEKALPLLSTLFPFALTTTPHLHQKARLGSWLLNVKYS